MALSLHAYSRDQLTVPSEDFIEQLLHHCGKWPEPKSVLVMDNASFHRSAKIEQLCIAAGVKLLYLPPYSLDLNPIEEFFAELKTFIKRNWQRYSNAPQQDFGAFLEWCVDNQVPRVIFGMLGFLLKNREGNCVIFYLICSYSIMHYIVWPKF